MNRKGISKLLSGVIALLLVGGSFFVGYKAGERHLTDIERVEDISNKENDKPAGVDFSTFWRAWNVINEKFVATKATTTDQEKVWGAIRGLASSLDDPYTTFLSPEENEIFQTSINGSFEGVGMELGLKEKTLTVIAPLKDTPAYRAGVKSGDLILKIDDTLTANFSVEKAVRIIRGKKGTPIRLTLYREGKNEPFEVTLIRDTIKIPTIDLEGKDASGNIVGKARGGENTQIGLTSDGVFVIRLYNFSAESPELFRLALRNFILSGSHKLIIDLRGNPGGYLEAAVDMASWFLPPGKVVVKEDFGTKRTGDEFRSRGYGNERFGIFKDNLKVVILVDNGSASASEILAGALQEHGVAKLVGTNTFGKGSVQELVPITSTTNLKVTIARWLTPKGISISERGIAPDVEVKVTEEDVKEKRDPQMQKAVELLRQEP